MERTCLVVMALTVSALGAGCGEEGDADGRGATMPCYPRDAAAADGDPDALYDAGEIPRFDFRLREESWAALQENARDEQYVEAEGCYNDSSLGLVGLRFKGGFGTLEMCYDETGELICPKLSMKVKFDEYVDGQRFYRQKRLNFHAMMRDGSKIRERIAYDLYRDMGVVAPRSAWATLRVNGERLGLFAMVEEIDGPFTESRFPEDPGGVLYKAAWPVTTDAAYYDERIETNEGDATHDRIVALAEALASTEGEERLAELAKWTDIDELHRYMAVDDAIMNFDGITTFYVEEKDVAVNHNYFLYEGPESGKLRLVPWDLDNTLSVLSFEYFGEVPHWTRTPERCPADFPVYMDTEEVRAPGCDVLFGALNRDLEGYRSAIRELLEGPFSEGRLEEQVDRYAALVRDAVAADPHLAGPEAWPDAIARLRRELPEMRARMQRLAGGAP